MDDYLMSFFNYFEEHGLCIRRSVNFIKLHFSELHPTLPEIFGQFHKKEEIDFKRSLSFRFNVNAKRKLRKENHASNGPHGTTWPVHRSEDEWLVEPTLYFT